MQDRTIVRALNGQGMLTEYKEPYVPEKEMQEELASPVHVPKLIIKKTMSTGRRLLNKTCGKWEFVDYKQSRKPKSASKKKWSKLVRAFIKNGGID